MAVRGWRLAVQRLAAEPLVWFVVLGALVFVANYVINTQATWQKEHIEVSAQTRQRLLQQAQQQWGQAPSERQVDTLVEAFVREEVLVREARAQGLDRDDAIVRRRLAQVMEFLAHDDVVSPTEAEQRDYLASHPERYQLPVRWDIEQVYVRPLAEPQATMDRALQLRGALLADPARAGDPFMLGRHLTAQTADGLAREFGESFAQAVSAQAVGEWSAPLASVYGLHLVRVRSRQAGGVAPWEQVRERVAADMVDARVGEARDAAYARLRARYTVLVAPETAQDRPIVGAGS